MPYYSIFTTNVARTLRAQFSSMLIASLFSFRSQHCVLSCQSLMWTYPQRGEIQRSARRGGDHQRDRGHHGRHYSCHHVHPIERQVPGLWDPWWSHTRLRRLVDLNYLDAMNFTHYLLVRDFDLCHLNLDKMSI